MQITSALVLLAVVWFMTLFCVLPLRMRSQADAGEVEPGTPASAPSGFVMRRKFAITTVVALVIWAPLCLLIIYDVLSWDSVNLYEWANPPET